MTSTSRIALIVALCACVATPVAAQSTGPDVIVGSLNGIRNYSPDAGGQSAFAIGTTSCNIGTAELLWIASNNQHPVIGQNIYRVKDGIFEQIGVSWLKHGFTALQQNLCGPCTSSGTGSRLGVGCSDPYSAGLNGSQGGLGPRDEVNAATGFFPYPFRSPSRSGNDRRILVDNQFLNPAQNAGARYFGEGQYVAPDDTAAGNGANNASYRELRVSGPNGVGWNMDFIAPTVREEPAIMAWPTVDPFAQVAFRDTPGDGRVYLGFHAIPSSGGFYRYVYAIHNLTSDRAIGSLNVQLPTGFTARNFEFRASGWHSGERFKADAWTPNVTANGITFQGPDTFATDQWGSAVRWGSTFTIVFEADADPTGASLGFFKPGGNPISFPPFLVPRAQWQVNGPEASFTVDGNQNDPFRGPARTSVGFGQTSQVDLAAAPGSSYDLFTSFAPVVPNGFVTPNGQIFNLDLAAPVFPLFGTFLPMPAGGSNFPVVAPSGPASVNAQMLALNAAAPDGVYSSAANEYTVGAVAPPTITDVSPRSAAGGDTVTITGTGFRPIPSIVVGGVPATVNSVTDTSVSFTMPTVALGCDTQLVYTAPDGASLSESMNPNPTVNNVLAPAGIPSAGNSLVVFQGTFLSPNHTVTVGGINAPVISGSTLAVIIRTPALPAGPQTVVITSPAGCSTTTSITYTP